MKKVIYTVITDHYDHLFPPMADQDGWDMICFTDDPDHYESDFWQVLPLPELFEFAQLENDPVRKARLVKLLPHRFLEEYDYSVYVDANRLLLKHMDEFAGDCTEPLLTLQSAFADPYAYADYLIFHADDKPNILNLADPPPFPEGEEALLKQQMKTWKKAKVPTYEGSPSTAVLGRRHGDKTVSTAMETLAAEVLGGSQFDEPSFPYACHKHKLAWKETLTVVCRPSEVFSEAERFALKMQHVYLGLESNQIDVDALYPPNPPPPGGKYEGYPFILTIGVPVSNQIGTIRRCLEGIKPLLDNLDAELVVVDTGSTDGTVEVCREFGARVINFPWVDDMSAARNTAIRHAKGLWYMSIDDDEWFEDVGPFLDFFNAKLYKEYEMAAYNQRNYIFKDMSTYSDHPTPRMGKMHPTLHFEGRIHDLLQRKTTKRKTAYIPAHANHLGFAEQGIGKSVRNISILRKETINYTKDMRFAHQMAKELSVLGFPPEACRMNYWVMAFARQYNNEGNLHWAHVNAATLVLISSNEQYNGRDGTLIYHRYIEPNLADYTDLDKCSMYKQTAMCYQKLPHTTTTDLRTSVSMFKKYLTLRKKVLALPSDKLSMQYAGLGINCVDDNNLANTVYLFGRCLITLSKTDDFAELALSEESLHIFNLPEHSLYRNLSLQQLVLCENWDALKGLLSNMVSQGNAQGLDYAFTTILEASYDLHRSEAATLVRQFTEDDGLLSFLTLWETEMDPKNPEELFEKALHYADELLFRTGDFFKVFLLYEAFHRHLDPFKALEIFDKNTVDYIFSALSSSGPINDVAAWLTSLYGYLKGWTQDITPESPPLQQYIAAGLAMYDFSNTAKDRFDEPDPYLDSFKTYVGARYGWEQCTLAEGLTDGIGSPLLGGQVRAVCAAHEAFTHMEEHRNTDALRSLKAALKLDANLEPVVSLLSERLVESTEEQLRQSSEFDMLMTGIKPKIEALIAAGNGAEAIPLLTQLEQMAPGDADIQEMKRRAGLVKPS